MHLEIESTVIAAANPDGQVPLITITVMMMIVIILQHCHLLINGMMMIIVIRLRSASMVSQLLGPMRTMRTGRLLR